MNFGVGIILIYLGIELIISRKEKKKTRRAVEATYFYYDLEDKIFDMLEDPFTTDNDWEEILPVCEYAQKLWLETHPYIDPNDPEIINLVELVKNIMA